MKNEQIAGNDTNDILVELEKAYTQAWNDLYAGFLGHSLVLPREETGPDSSPDQTAAWRPLSPEVLRRIAGEMTLEPKQEKPQPFVWKEISDKELACQLRILQIPVGCTLCFEVCGGFVLVDPWNLRAWSEGVPSNKTVILGNYGIGYGTMVSGQSISRSLHRQERMTCLTWDEAWYVTRERAELLPLRRNEYFQSGIKYDLDMKFSRYVKAKAELYEATNQQGHPEESSPGSPQDSNPEADFDVNTEDTSDTALARLADLGTDVEIQTVKVVQEEACPQDHSPTVDHSVDNREAFSSGTDPSEKQPQKTRPYFLDTTPEALAHRQSDMIQEQMILKEENVKILTMEEIKKQDESSLFPTRQGSMDPAEMAAELRAVLDQTVEELLDHQEHFIHPKTKQPSSRGYVEYGGISLNALIRYMMCGLGGESAQTAPASFFVNQTTGAASIAQARWQITEAGMKFFFEEFNRKLSRSEKLSPLLTGSIGNFIPLAVDGSSINIPYNPDDPDTLCKGAHGSEYNQIHALCVYGLLSGIYHGVVATGKKKADEREALLDFISKGTYSDFDYDGDKKPVVVGDRGFESWEIFTRLNMMGISFVVRIKDSHSNGILSKYNLEQYNLGEEFQRYFRVSFYAPGCKDDAPEGARLAHFLDKETKSYEMVLRVVQFSLEKGNNLETLITNIPTWELSARQLEQLYNARWQVETSFRTLKYQFNLKYFHARNETFVKQEFWAKMVMFNFSSLLMTHSKVPEAKWSKGRKYDYAIKRSWGASLLMQYLKENIDSELLGRKIVMNLQPIRPNRNYARKVRPQSAVDFNYRAVG